MVFLFCAYPVPSFALNVIEKNDFYIYYPEDASALAAQLTQQISEVATFLEAHSLPVSRPMHVVLDAELDHPEVMTILYPHREIRLPLRAPGVLEDGYTEPDPWRYFLFKGLCAQSIYTERSGLPGGLYWVFGEIISPNLILPDWITDGISHLLYEQFVQRPVDEPLSRAIFNATSVPNLDRVSNHPEIWPGRYSYRIYGRPFIRWMHQRYGWDNLLTFLQRHGRGIVPFEIDIKAKQAFGLTWNQIWRYFQAEHIPKAYDNKGFSITGYWHDPFVYWNATGINPGIASIERRGRYGFVDPHGWLWFSQFTDGVSQLRLRQGDTARTLDVDHVWDPGPGAVAVTRQGIRPCLVLFDTRKEPTFFGDHFETITIRKMVMAPDHVTQLSGPVMDDKGRIAVAANSNGNWDIWIYDSTWHRITDAPSIEMDPWIANGKLIFSSNSSGTFQLQGVAMRPLTEAPFAAMLPRGRSFLDMGAVGWRLDTLTIDTLPVLPAALPPTQQSRGKVLESMANGRPYTALKSIWPNQLAPDIFFDTEQFQFGLSTEALDVSKTYAWDAGIRYDTNESRLTWRLGWQATQMSVRATRYPFGYETERKAKVDEIRTEVKVAWSPLRLKALSLSANWRQYAPQDDEGISEEEWWAALGWEDTLGQLHLLANIDIFDDDSQSLYGSLVYWSGQRISMALRLEAGKTWGDLNLGHNTFRIGGYSSEGGFTRRATRLFPIRGFDANILDAGQAAAAGLEMVWPLAKLQTGYKTLPLFLHNISVGTFVDSGFAADEFSYDHVLVSAGFELITGMELAWGSMSDFRIGIAWPLRQPDNVEDSGPVILLQIGSPL